MKNLTLTLLLITLTISIVAQDQVNKSVISTVDGSVYIGEVISENILDVKMVLNTMDTIYIDKRTIKRMRGTGKMKNLPQDAIVFDKGKFHRTAGLFISFNLHAGYASNEKGTGVFSFIVGKRLNEKWHVGIGYGMSISNVQLPGRFHSEHKFQNFFTYGRYNIRRNKLQIFAESSLGVGVESQGDGWFNHLYSNGVYFQPGVGIEFASRNKLKWSIKLSQFIQHTSGEAFFFDSDLNQTNYSYDQLYDRSLLGIGVTF